MTRTSHRTVIGAVALSLAFFAAACGTSSGSDSAKEETTTTAKAADESTTTTTAADDDGEATDPDAQARADSVDLTVSDFPDGWEATPGSDSDEESPLNDCDPRLGDRSVQLARHSTDEFSVGSMDAGDGTQVTARTVVFEDETAAEDAVAPFTEPDVISCIDDALKSAFSSAGQDVTVEGTLGLGDATFDVDDTVALSASYTLTAGDGSTLDLNFGVLVLRVGDIATNVVVQSVDPDFDVTTLPIDTLVEQLNAA